jgi:hypothetical protein
MVTVMVSIIYEFSQKAENIGRELEKVAINRNADIIEGGPIEIYADIERELESRLKSGVNKPIEIDVLGYTLYSIQPKIKLWIKKGLLRHVTVNLYCLHSEFIEESECMDSSWVHNSKEYPKLIEDVVRKNMSDLIKDDVKINICRFRHIPAIHGFRIGHGNLYISFALWDKAVIDDADGSTFERIHGSDMSKHAICMRELYSNWIDASECLGDKTNFEQIDALEPLARSNDL